jgi:hypothetical protein
MNVHARRSRALLVLIVMLGSFLSLDAPVAGAGVRAFSTATGTEDRAFVMLGSVGRPSAVIPDGKRGVYVAGHLTAGGQARAIVHVLPDGKVDPSFRASAGLGEVLAGAVRGNELALLGRFGRIDGQRRRNIAVLDTRTGRLLNWTPRLPGAAMGEGFSHVVFTATRLVAGSVGSVAAWRDGVSEPIWEHRFPTGSRHDLVPEIASWHGSILVADPNTEKVFRMTPADGHSKLVATNFRWGQFQNIGGRLFYGVEGNYAVYGSAASTHCGQDTGTTASGALAGTARTLFVAAEPIDADPPAPPGTIYACSRGDAQVPGFTPPTLPVSSQYVWAIAVVGSHLLVFTGKL